jgi:putative tricarboxylic transport membrane protein
VVRRAADRTRDRRGSAALIYPTIFILTLVATYSLRNELFDLYVTLAFGVIGYFLRRGGFSAPAFIIAFVLSVGAEQTLRQTLLMSNDGWAIFAERPAAMFFLVLGFAVLIWRSVQGLRQQAAATSSA